jgi:hypothetical protein
LKQEARFTAAPAYADRPDYNVIEDGRIIGRMRFATFRTMCAGWSIAAFHVDPALWITTHNRVPSLEEAKAQFRASWSAVCEALQPKKRRRL